MNAAKHTPGPWEADTADIGFAGGGERDVCPTKRRGRSPNGGFIIARLSGPDRAANARLIAAAPELVHSLDEIVKLCAIGDVDENTEAYGWGEAIARAKRAIAKATGSAQ